MDRSGAATRDDTQAERAEPWVILGTGTESPSSALLARAKALTSKDKIIAPVLEEHSPWWERTISELPKDNIVVQPIDRGSAAAMLLALLRIFARDPNACIVLLWDPEGDPVAAPATSLLILFQSRLKELYDLFMARLGGPAARQDVVLEDLYPFLPKVDFVRDALLGARDLVRRVVPQPA